MMRKKTYEAPVVKHVEFQIEAGFSASDPEGNILPQMSLNTDNYQEDNNWHASNYFGNN